MVINEINSRKMTFSRQWTTQIFGEILTFGLGISILYLQKQNRKITN